MLGDVRADSKISLSVVGDGRDGVVVLPPRLMPAGTLEIGRDSSAEVGLVTAPMVADASASEKFSDKESLISDSAAMAQFSNV